MLLFLMTSVSSLIASRQPVLRRVSTDDVVEASISGMKVEQAMESMSSGERCEAVVLSMISRGEIDEALELLKEEPLGITGRVGKSLVEFATKSKDAETMERAMRGARFANYGREFAADPERNKDRRARFLASEKDTDIDSRTVEISAALGSVGVAFSALATAGVDAVVGLDPTAPDVVLALMALAGGLDVWKNGGKATSIVGSGVSRLAVDDPRREAEAEAAAFLVGYLLGIPAFAFKPTAFEALKLLVDLDDTGRQTFPHSPVFAWLAAPTAAESNRHRKLIVSDPRQVIAAVQIATDRNVILPQEQDDVPPADRLKWATRQARALLTSYAQLHRKLTDRFEAKNASPADCVELIERELK